MVFFSVTGVCRQSMAKTSTMTIRVPRNRMAQAMQNIHRMGGRIADIGFNVSTSVSESSEE
ncbi:MAG: phycobilisome linker polypeptide [Cyanobacteria bacterium P01_F01_bin.42]